MLQPAELRALAAIDAGAVGLDPLMIGNAGDHFGLAGQCRDPEGMDDVGAAEVDFDRNARGDVDFVGRREFRSAAGCRVIDLPPPVIAGDMNCERGRPGRAGHLRQGDQGIDRHPEKQDDGAARPDEHPAHAVTGAGDDIGASVRPAPHDGQQEQDGDDNAHRCHDAGKDPLEKEGRSCRRPGAPQEVVKRRSGRHCGRA